MKKECNICKKIITRIPKAIIDTGDKIICKDCYNKSKKPVIDVWAEPY